MSQKLCCYIYWGNAFPPTPLPPPPLQNRFCKPHGPQNAIVYVDFFAFLPPMAQRFHIDTTTTSGYYTCINLNNLLMNNLITTIFNIVYITGFVSVLTFTIITIVNN